MLKIREMLEGPGFPFFRSSSSRQRANLETKSNVREGVMDRFMVRGREKRDRGVSCSETEAKGKMKGSERLGSEK